MYIKQVCKSEVFKKVCFVLVSNNVLAWFVVIRYSSSFVHSFVRSLNEKFARIRSLPAGLVIWLQVFSAIYFVPLACLVRLSIYVCACMLAEYSVIAQLVSACSLLRSLASAQKFAATTAAAATNMYRICAELFSQTDAHTVMPRHYSCCSKNRYHTLLRTKENLLISLSLTLSISISIAIFRSFYLSLFQSCSHYPIRCRPRLWRLQVSHTHTHQSNLLLLLLTDSDSAAVGCVCVYVCLSVCLSACQWVSVRLFVCVIGRINQICSLLAFREFLGHNFNLQQKKKQLSSSAPSSLLFARVEATNLLQSCHVATWT